MNRFILFLLLAIVTIPASRAQAQELRKKSHAMTIERGRIHVDGIEIPEKELPESLDLSNVTASVNLTGNTMIGVNGIMFQLRDGRIVEVDGDETGLGYSFSVFFGNPDRNDETVLVSNSRYAPFTPQVASGGAYGVVMKNYVRKLNDKAVTFAKIGSRMNVENQNWLVHVELAEQLKLEAENTARIAGAFPRVEYEGYLRGIHETDSKLYNRLVQEHNLELITHDLALQTRTTTDPAEREDLAAQLHTQLEEIFELKQQNREDEIDQLSLRLRELTELMNKRMALRNRIVESRLKELLGELDW